LLFAAFSLVVSQAAPGVTDLSGPFLSGSIISYEITPDGSRVVFIGSFDSSHLELYSVPIDGSAPPVQLSSPLGAGLVSTVLLDPTGTYAVYVGIEGGTNERDLYTVPVTGSAPAIKLTDENQASYSLTNAFVGTFNQPGAYEPRLTPDGQYVVFLTRRATEPDFRLFAAPIDGSAPMSPLTSGPILRDFVVAPYAADPTGASILFLSPPSGSSDVALFRVPTDGSAPPVQLSVHPGPHTSAVRDFETSPDGAYVLYRGDLETDEIQELFIQPLGGGPAVKLSGAMVSGGDVDDDDDEDAFNHAYAFGPDGARVLYRADQDVDGKFELFSVPSDAGMAPVKLNAPLVGDFEAFWQRPFAFSADSATVVYAAEQDSTRAELFAVPADGSTAPIRLHPPEPAPVRFNLRAFAVVGPEDHVVSYWPGIASGTGKISVSAIDGSQHLDAISGSTLVAPTSPYFALTPDVRHVFFRARPTDGVSFQLYRASLSGGPPRDVSGPQGSSGLSNGWQVSSDGRFVVYLGVYPGEIQRRLFSAHLPPRGNLHGPPAPQPLSGPRVP